MLSPRWMVRLATTPMPFPGTCSMEKGGGKSSSGGFGGAVKAEKEAMRNAMWGLVTMEIPRPS
jgi:hypothetical protein